MNQLVTSFLSKAADDPRLLPTHLSLMTSMFYFEKQDTQQAFIRVSRSKLMRYSRIRSIATYHRCLKDLICYGYIRYEPSYHPTGASKVWLLEEPGPPS